MRIKLILPKRAPSLLEHYVSRSEKGASAQQMETFASLPLIAALTPPEYTVSILDENVECIPFDEEADLVGISLSHTYQAPRAYQISERFRSKGIKVLLGGTHVTVMPQEAGKHADSIVIGEAEPVWRRILDDFKHNNLKKIYTAETYTDMAELPSSKKELLKLDRYLIDFIETTRGCPHNCSFCAAKSVFGTTFRFRPVDKVIEEVSNSKFKFIDLGDSTLMAHPVDFKRFLKELIPLKINWQIEAPVYLAEDDELLKLCAESGCRFLSFGFESIKTENLKTLGKEFNAVEKYKEAIKKCHNYGITVVGLFMFGLDYDDETYFDEFLDFVEETKMDQFVANIITPFPGTRLFWELEKEGRIFERNWEKYDSTHIVFKPKNISVQKLYKGMLKVWMRGDKLWSKYYEKVMEKR